MNELQLSLLAIGALVILAVVAFNRWQERKYRRQAEQRFQSQHDDVLLGEGAISERVEPVLDPIPQPEIEAFEEPVLAHEHPPSRIDTTEPVVAAEAVEEQMGVEAEEVGTAFIPTQPASIPAAHQDAALAPDPATEYVATLNMSDPISAQALALVLQQLRSVGKAVRWLGQRNHQVFWEDISHAAPATEYVKLTACMQLADRNGPALADELNAFCDMTQAIAANLYAVIDFPDKQAALAAAADLDQFCADVDVLFGVNIVSKDGSPFAGTKLRGLAESAGMKLMPDGNFHYFNDQGEALFALGNLEPAPFTADAMRHLSTHGVTFTFDVPKASGGVQAFNHMLLAARQFTGPLGALMVDDNRKELTEPSLDKIRQQLIAIYDKMEQRGISAGGPRSRRLFA